MANKAHNIPQLLSKALAFHQTGNIADAEALYLQILKTHPNHPDALSQLGTLCIQKGNLEEAARLFQASLAVKPSQPDMHNNLGCVLRALNKPDEAMHSFDKAIALSPTNSSFYYNRAVIFQEMKCFDEALINYDKALALDPNNAEAFGNRGATFWELKRHDEALINYNKAIALNPNKANTYNNRAAIFFELQQYDKALTDFQQALILNPQTPEAFGYWLHTKKHICDWQGIEDNMKILAEKIEANEPAATPFVLMGTPLSTALQQKTAQIYINNKFPPSASPLWRGEKYSHDRIRIGYFSSDFYNHATAYLMAGLFESHDRSKFEISAFSFGQPLHDEMRHRLEKSFDHFIDVNGKSDKDIAALARSMEIDIAVDLKGFTQNARTGIFALCPAPIQVNYLGYPGTMGASYMDYLIADSTVIPEGDKQYYSEKIVYLPDSYQVTDSTRRVSQKRFTRAEMGLPETGFVFCCFNNNYKITPKVFDIWIRLLQKVEGSVLWLFEGNETVTMNLRTEAVARGIAPDRLIFAKRMSQTDHLARQQLADLFLDTFYYNAHTTASDALWEGLPVLTCPGETFASRVAASLLSATGLPEMITQSHVEYEALALELATTPQKLAAIRQKLEQNRATCPLFDTRRFTQHFEEACVKMWERSQAGLPPDHISIRK